MRAVGLFWGTPEGMHVKHFAQYLANGNVIITCLIPDLFGFNLCCDQQGSLALCFRDAACLWDSSLMFIVVISLGTSSI